MNQNSQLFSSLHELWYVFSGLCPTTPQQLLTAGPYGVSFRTCVAQLLAKAPREMPHRLLGPHLCAVPSSPGCCSASPSVSAAPNSDLCLISISPRHRKHPRPISRVNVELTSYVSLLPKIGVLCCSPKPANTCLTYFFQFSSWLWWEGKSNTHYPIMTKGKSLSSMFF